MPVICHILIFLHNAEPYFQARRSDPVLRCCHTTTFPCRIRQNCRSCCSLLLDPLIADCGLLQVEGLSVLPPGDRRCLLAFLSDYASRKKIPLLLL